MLIEQALYTLPEIMALRISSRFYESSVSSAFAMSLSMLLSSRSISNPHLQIQQEAIYKSAEVLGRNLRADMMVEMPQIGTNSIVEHSFGYRRENFIEIKFFRSPGKSDHAPGTVNAGALVAEMLRLVVLPFEMQGKHREVGRYLLHVYQGKPSVHVAFNRRGGVRRQWAYDLFEPGTQEVSIDLSGEPKVLVGAVGTGMADLQLDLEVTNTVLRPMYVHNESRDFMFCLTRINRARIGLGEHSCKIPAHGYMGAEDVQALEQVRRRVIDLYRVDE